MRGSTTVRPPAGATPEARHIEPRIAARRDEVERARSRTVRRRLLVVLGVLAALAGAVGVTRTPLLDVDQVVIEGNDVVTTRAVVLASGVQRGDRMTGVDTAIVADRIRGVPWVHEATVVREWPGTVRITLTERQPIAVVDGPSGALVVDTHGRVLGPAAPTHGTLVRLTGEVDAEPGDELGRRWRSPLAVARRLPIGLRTSVAAVGSGAEGTILTLTTGTVVDLCDASALDAKLGALVALVQRADPATAASIDLCVPGAPALTRRPGGA